jgi:hypothetical protein
MFGTLGPLGTLGTLGPLGILDGKRAKDAKDAKNYTPPPWHSWPFSRQNRPLDGRMSDFTR